MANIVTQNLRQALFNRHTGSDSNALPVVFDEDFQAQTGDKVLLSVADRGFSQAPFSDAPEMRDEYMAIRHHLTIHGGLSLVHLTIQSGMDMVKEVLLGDMLWLKANQQLVVGVNHFGLERCDLAVHQIKGAGRPSQRVVGMLDLFADAHMAADEFEILSPDIGIDVVPTHIGIYGLGGNEPIVRSLQ